MTKKIKLEDGTELEIPSEEELKALEEKANKAQELEAKVTEAEAKVKEYEDNPTEKNWRLFRESAKKKEALLKEKGIEIKDDGTIVEMNKHEPMSGEEIDKRARAAALEVAIENRKLEKLSRFKDEDKKVVEYYYNKLASGEEMNLEKVDKIIQEASIHLAPPSKHTEPVINGMPPRFTEDFNKRDDFAESDLAKHLANEAFGDESFAKSK
jgi:hypothetical protein